jgi:hypothetical protein
VLHAMSWISALLNGTSPLHVKEDGTPVVSESVITLSGSWDALVSGFRNRQ